MKLNRISSTLASVALVTISGFGMSIASLVAPGQQAPAQAQSGSVNTLRGCYQNVAFSGRIAFNPTNIRREPSTSSQIVGQFRQVGETIRFGGVATGSAVNDAWDNKLDNMWYRVDNYRGVSGWAAGAVVNGYPPSGSCVSLPTNAVQRAKVWVDRGVRYNWNTAAYPNGDLNQYGNEGYRTDCAGLVSMAWNLPANGLRVPVTSTLPSYATTLSGPSSLQPGDAINNRGIGARGHVVLFVGWINQAQGKFIAYEQNGGQGKAVRTELTLQNTSSGWTIKEYQAAAPGPYSFERKK
jgi:hypothetical protein